MNGDQDGGAREHPSPLEALTPLQKGLSGRLPRLSGHRAGPDVGCPFSPTWPTARQASALTSRLISVGTLPPRQIPCPTHPLRSAGEPHSTEETAVGHKICEVLADCAPSRLPPGPASSPPPLNVTLQLRSTPCTEADQSLPLRLCSRKHLSS